MGLNILIATFFIFLFDKYLLNTYLMYVSHYIWYWVTTVSTKHKVPTHMEFKF